MFKLVSYKNYFLVVASVFILVSILFFFFTMKEEVVSDIEFPVPFGSVDEVEGLEIFTMTPKHGLRGKYTYEGKVIYFEVFRVGMRHPKFIQDLLCVNEYGVYIQFFTKEGEGFLTEHSGLPDPRMHRVSPKPSNEWIEWTGWVDTDHNLQPDNFYKLDGVSMSNDYLYPRYEMALFVAKAMKESGLFSHIEFEVESMYLKASNTNKILNNIF
jgi:hypothetical protein